MLLQNWVRKGVCVTSKFEGYKLVNDKLIEFRAEKYPLKKMKVFLKIAK